MLSSIRPTRFFRSLFLRHHRASHPVLASHIAAAKIQRAWRAKRSRMKKMKQNNSNPNPIPISLRAANASNPPLSLSTRYYLSSGSYYQSLIDSSYSPAFLHYCARRIQICWFQARFRRFARYRRRIIYERAAESIQRRWRRHRARTAAAAGKDEPNRGDLYSAAAACIQRCFRRWNYRRTYRYYRGLLRSYESQNPHRLFRLLIHDAAIPLDSTSGLFLRFRLGGSTFPPHIYYRVYSNMPVVDLQSFAPRDYAEENKKIAKLAKQTEFNADERRAAEERIRADQSNWYRRDDNNKWRILTDSKLVETIDAMANSGAAASGRSASFYHPNRLVRYADALKRRKQKQLQWKLKLYKLGMVKENNKNNDFEGENKENISSHLANNTRAMRESKYASDQDTYNSDSDNHNDSASAAGSGSGSGSGIDSDGEVSSLVEWAAELNFDDYCDNWNKLATSKAENQGNMKARGNSLKH